MRPDSDEEGHAAYGFPPGLPVSQAAPGTNLLVSGPSGGGAHEVALNLLASAGRRECVLLLSADISGRALLQRLDDSPWPVTRSMLGIVDCTGTDDHEEERFTTHGDPIDDPGDLAAIEIEFSLLYEKLAAREPAGVRIGLLSLSSLLADAPHREVTRFVHLLTGRIIATDDLGVFVVDSSRVAPGTVAALSHFCDRHVRVRSDDDQLEISVDADSESESWTPVDYDVALEEWLDGPATR
jgi:hypothetical protein